MIVGLDNSGEVYLSLVQGNSNSKIMEIFFHNLCRKLEKENPNFRENLVLLLDNAAYHTCPATLAVIKKLKLQVLFTDPNSYLAAPIELLFGAFKSRDINPRKVKTGKR
jgi:transposase